MFTHILVPLDGSEPAEAAAAVAAGVATQFGAETTLLHVIERRAPQAVHGERHLAQPAEAKAYLAELTRRFFADPSRVAEHVHLEGESDVAQSIVRHADELRSDLVVLCTHGRGVLRHRLFGSVAQYVLAHRAVPVLLVPPAARAPVPPFPCRRLLVPLDGRPEHERGLSVAVGLARVSGATIHVVWVVPTLATLSGERAAAGHLLPGTATALLDLEEAEAENYLRDRRARLAAEDLEITCEVARGDPAEVILATAARVRADLVVAGTHGRVGLDAFWAGSVAPRVARRLDIPVLLVPLAATTAPA
jgi:nucleotide-binding universal stress UspA family protein